MNIEIVEFYYLTNRKKDKTPIGTLHIYLVDYQIDIRGIRAIMTKNSILLDLPSMLGVDEETGEKVRYPIFSFTDFSKNKEIKQAIREKLPKFLQEKNQNE